MTARKPSGKAFADYLSETGSLPSEVLLGHVVMFTITDVRVAHADLEKTFIDNRLSTDLLPPQIKPIDAFKKATSETKDKYPMSHGRTAIVMCRDVASTEHVVTRQITREIRDSANHKLAYDKIIECTFFRAPLDSKGRVTHGGERVNFVLDVDGLEVDEVDRAKAMVQAMTLRYTDYADYLDGNKLRHVVRQYVKFLNGIELKPGVYFVHANRQPELTQLREAVTALGGGCRLQMVPLVNLEDQKEMVVEAFQRESEQELAELTNAIAQVQSERKKISQTAFESLLSRYDEAVAKADEYTTVLDMHGAITSAAQESADKALDSLRIAYMTQGGE